MSKKWCTGTSEILYKLRRTHCRVGRRHHDRTFVTTACRPCSGTLDGHSCGKVQTAPCNRAKCSCCFQNSNFLDTNKQTAFCVRLLCICRSVLALLVSVVVLVHHHHSTLWLLTRTTPLHIFLLSFSNDSTTIFFSFFFLNQSKAEKTAPQTGDCEPRSHPERHCFQVPCTTRFAHMPLSLSLSTCLMPVLLFFVC